MTVHEGVLPKINFLLCVFYGQKDLTQGIHKEMFPVYGGKCLSLKTVHSWAANVSLMTKRLQRGAEVAETTVKDCYAAGFNALLKRWNKCINVGGGYVEK
jgi:hypothetical protein